MRSGDGDNTTPRGSEYPFGGGRHRTNGTNGVHPEGMNTRPIPMDEPIDLVAVQADDELINALRSGMSVSAPGVHGYDADDHVAAILAAWKAEVDADPIPELVDIDTAMAAIQAGRPSTARRVGRHLAPVAAAAAFVVLAIGGVSIGSASSEPGDALWGVSKVLYSERAQSVEAAVSAEDHITSAKQALVDGQPEVAAQQLQAANADLAAVRPQEGKAELADVQNFLVAKAAETPPGQPTDPGAPLKKDRTRKVPKGAELSQSPRPTDPDPVTTTNAPAPDPSSGGVVTSQNPAVTGPSAPTSAPSNTDGRVDPTTGATSTPVTEGGPATTTPKPQGMGGAEGAPSSSTTASGTGTTVPAPGTS